MSSILIEVCCELFQVVADVAASAEELTNPFVKEGFEVYGRQSKGTKIVDLIKAVEQQESVLGELQKELEDLNAMMIERKNQRQHQQGKMNFSDFGEGSVGHSQTPNSNHPTGCIEFGNSGDGVMWKKFIFQIRKHKNVNKETCMSDEGRVLGCVLRV